MWSSQIHEALVKADMHLVVTKQYPPIPTQQVARIYSSSLSSGDGSIPSPSGDRGNV